MRLNIERSSWQSRGHSYVFTDAELTRLRLSGTWFDGNLHGRRQCTTEQIIAKMATHDNAMWWSSETSLQALDGLPWV